MKLIIEIDTTQPIDKKRLLAESAFIKHVAETAEEFFKNAPGNETSVFQAPAVPYVSPLLSQYEVGELASSAPTAPPAPAATATPPAPPAPTVNVTTPPAPPIPGATATPPAPPAPSANVDVDKNGIPWDSRIHAGTKNKTAKGDWKRARNVDDSTFAIVSNELRAAMGLPPGSYSIKPHDLAEDNTPPAPPAPGASAPTPPAPPAPNAGVADDGQMAAAIAKGVADGKITMADVGTQCVMIGFGNLGEVLRTPGAIKPVYAHFQALLG